MLKTYLSILGGFVVLLALMLVLNQPDEPKKSNRHPKAITKAAPPASPDMDASTDEHVITEAAFECNPVPVAHVPWTQMDEIPEPPIRFEMPVDCSAVKGCFIQNYVDIDPTSPDWRDYACGHLSYDGHDGIDFRIHTRREMLMKDIPVLAAAGGTVFATRDGMADRYMTAELKAQMEKDHNGCGNAVIIDHTDGWRSMYCHMKKNSIMVKAKEAVAPGQLLGYIGLSGMTEFPHLHFSVMHEGVKTDPFTGKPVLTDKTPGTRMAKFDESTCNPSLHSSLWSDRARKELGYMTTAIMGSGFMNRVPTPEQVREGDLQPDSLPQESDMLIFWTDISGIRKGDKSVSMLLAPDGSVLASNEETYQRPHAAMFRYIGAKRPKEGWPPGEYKGVQRLMRCEEQVVVVRDGIAIK